MRNFFPLVASLIISVSSIILANYGVDNAYVAQMLVIAAASFASFLYFVSVCLTAPVAVNEDEYLDGVVKLSVIATVIFGLLGFFAGTFIAFQLAFPTLNFEWSNGILNFGRLRPVHTSIVIFGFGGNALLASSLYIVQRTTAARLWGGNLAYWVFWGYQLFLVTAVVGYMLGATQTHEYAESEWISDWILLGVWVPYLMVFMGTLLRRREPHIYVANWFFLAFIITVAMLHIFNNISIPVTLLGSKSVSLFAGVQDAMVQWWYGHNAVGFFLTAGFLAMMYYFIPKQAERPVYSYKLSIIHFWAVIFIYIWAGPHHLHYTALPDWASTLGMAFSIALWMPSWGGMINGIMTLSGAWDKLRTDPVLRMLVMSVAFYGMSTFEGPVMSIRAINSLSHYTDWTIGHVHSGALGWNGLITFGALYFLVPRLWNKESLYSIKAVSWHFWLATIGIVFYAASMWVSGIMEGLMWREVDENGFLVNSFADTVEAKFPMLVVRGLGGVMYMAGALIMTWNLWMTVKHGVKKEEKVEEASAAS